MSGKESHKFGTPGEVDVTEMLMQPGDAGCWSGVISGGPKTDVSYNLHEQKTPKLGL